MSNRLNLDIHTLAEGEVAERINNEMAKIAENILDLNTDPSKARKLIVEIEFKPNDKRSQLDTKISVKSKIEPQIKASTTMLIGRDFNTGMMAMNELQSGTKGQMFFDPNDSKLKTDIGEDVEEIENTEVVIDFNKRKTNGGK